MPTLGAGSAVVYNGRIIAAEGELRRVSSRGPSVRWIIRSGEDTWMILPSCLRQPVAASLSSAIAYISRVGR